MENNNVLFKNPESKNKLYTVDEVIKGILPLGKSTVYKYITEGKIQCVCFGRRKFISGETLEELLKLGIQ